MLPFAVLTAAMALVGSYLVTQLVTGSLEERFTNQLLESSRTTSDALVRQEQQHLSVLRTAIFTAGVAGATATGDGAGLETLLDPVLSNADVFRLEVLDATGMPLYGKTALSPGDLEPIGSDDASAPSWSIVTDALTGRADLYGDKWAQIVETATGPALFTAAPIVDGGSVIGVVVVGTPLSEMLPLVRAQALANVTVYAVDGRPLASTFAAVSSDLAGLAPLAPVSLARQSLVRERREFAGRGYEVLYSPLVVRNDVVGMQSVALPTDYVANAGSTARWQMAGFFGLITVSVLAVGWLLARHLTIPLLRLVGAARALAGGDFTARSDVHTADEIGVLAVTFDAMAERLQRQHLATIGALASAIDARDPYTAGHSLRVGELSAAIGRDLGLPSGSVHHLHVGGILHDIGKIGIRDSVLLKRGALTDEERVLIEQHPQIGLRILAPAGLPPEVLSIVGGHHERLDGNGYPLGLDADELAIFPRIAAVADVYDALTTHRPYRPAMTVEDALRLLQREAADGLLDPEVINSMRRLAQQWEEHVRSQNQVRQRMRADLVRSAA
ncbi:MAG: HD-GYP domain-containing protein [Dehalococcoidia bacterium]